MSDRPVAILTRRPEDDAALADDLRRRGHDVIRIPCVRSEPLADTAALRAAIAELGPDDVLVLTSRSGADAVASAGPPRCEVAAVGSATAERARSLGMRVGFVPSRADGRTLGRELPLPRGRVVLARSDLADPDLPRILRERGALVRELVAYRTVAGAHGDLAAARAALLRGAPTIFVASPSAVDALAAAFDVDALRRARFIAIGPRTADHARRRIGVDAAAGEEVPA